MTVYLIVGVPCSGKSWVCEQLTDLYDYIPHDEHIGGDYIAAIRGASEQATKPLLIETPFSVSQIVGPLESQGLKVVPVYIIEDRVLLAERYDARENKPIPQGHLTRQVTYGLRAKAGDSFIGTSSEVLAHMRAL